MQKQTKNDKVEELERKLKQSEQDKEQLSIAIHELNQCYQIKIQLLNQTITAYESRLEELLIWKKQFIDKELSSTCKYEEENKKLLAIIDQLYLTFDGEKQKMEREIQDKDEEINRIAQQKEEIAFKSQQNEHKIDQLVKEHMKEIDELKLQLKVLKDQIIDSNNQGSTSKQGTSAESQIIEITEVSQESMPLKQINNLNLKEATESKGETKVKQLVYRSPDPSIHLSRV